MFPSDLPPQPSDGGTCSCTCLCCGPSSSPSASWRRSLKRKLDDLEEQHQQQLRVSSSSHGSDDVSARVEIKIEAAALRETLGSHQHSIQELYEDLEEERSASASAASEAMSMILRLQREKAEAQMEFRQFKRLAEEKMTHYQEEIAVLEELIFKRDQALQSLACEIQAYKHRLMSYGYASTLSDPPSPNTATAAAAAAFDYPPLHCKVPTGPCIEDEHAAADLEKYAFSETPQDRIWNLEQRISQMERMPSISHEKGVVTISPRQPWQSSKLSVDSYSSSPFAMKREEFPVAVERGWERDDLADRVYTVHAVHCEPESFESTPRDFWRNNEKKVLGERAGKMEEDEIKRLSMRLQELEADRETMRQTILSVGTDKAQLVLLKEIAQHLCKEPRPPPQQQQQATQQRMVRRPSFFRSFSILSAVKWITSFVFWRKSSRTRYTCGLTNSNVGLLLLLDKAPRMRRCFTRTLR